MAQLASLKVVATQARQINGWPGNEEAWAKLMRSLCLFVAVFMAVGLTAWKVVTWSRVGERGHPQLEGAPWRFHVISDMSEGADGAKSGDINGDGLPDLAVGWEEGGVTTVHFHPGYAESKSAWPTVVVGRTPRVEDAIFCDIDHDEQLEVLSFTEGDDSSIYIHRAPENSAQMLDPSAWRQEVLPGSRGRMMWMHGWPADIRGPRMADLLAAGKGGAAAVGWFEVPPDNASTNEWQWNPISPVGWLMSMWTRDMDGDGDEDVIISDRRGAASGVRWLENPGSGPLQRQEWKSHTVGAEGREVMDIVLADIDNDGLEDVVVAVNDGSLLWVRRSDGSGKAWETESVELPADIGQPRGVGVADMDRDGLRDTVITTWNAQGKNGAIWLRQARATGNENRWEAKQISGRSKGQKYDRVELLDVDGDGDMDLVTTEEQEGGRGLGVVWFENPQRN